MLVYNSWSINTFLSTSLQTTHILQSRIMYRSHAITSGYLSIAILHNQSSSYASVLLGKCTYQNTYVKWMQEYSNKLFIKYSSKAYILTNSLEKTLHHFLFRFNIFFCIFCTPSTKRTEGQSRHRNTSLKRLFRGQVKLSGKTYICILLPLMRGERLHQCLSTKECKWIHEWNSAEPLFGITQRGKSWHGIHLVPELSFCLQSSSDFKSIWARLNDASNRDQIPKHTQTV